MVAVKADSLKVNHGLRRSTKMQKIKDNREPEVEPQSRKKHKKL